MPFWIVFLLIWAGVGSGVWLVSYPLVRLPAPNAVVRFGRALGAWIGTVLWWPLTLHALSDQDDQR